MTTLFSGRATRVAAGSLAALLVAACAALAQNPPLGEVARQEQERRKTTKPATKVLTNKDLPTVTSPAPNPPPAPPDAQKVDAGIPEPAKDAKDDKEPVKDEAWWRARISEPRNQLGRDEVMLDALQARVNGLTAAFAGRDDPYQRAQIGEDRQKAIAEMDRVRAEIVDLKKKIEDIEEDARRSSVPPGWLR
jgi:hypothetical protein